MGMTWLRCAKNNLSVVSKRLTMARKKSMTRAEMISTLKSRGQKGELSKMTKPQLKALLDKTAPPGAQTHEDKPKSEIALEPDEQGGGHYFRKDGKTVSDGAHEVSIVFAICMVGSSKVCVHLCWLKPQKM